MLAKPRLPRAASIGLALFVDESEPKPNRNWLVIGVLAIPHSFRQSYYQALVHARAREAYEGEIHWYDLKRSFDGIYSAPNRVARSWLTWYSQAEHAYFTALAVDRPRLKRNRFPDEVTMRNRFTRMAIESALAHLPLWQETREVHLSILIDDRTRSHTSAGREDNLEDYLPRKLQVESWDNRGIIYSFARVPVRRASQECIFLQLTDILTGACGAALANTATRPAKRALADLARRFIEENIIDLWAFPDEHGKPYKPI
uniref:DUF3800 domain-containing protein n=1 Tax=Thermomicrobium roseum TaxID=500 RepID=A0A7C2BDI9_THERO